MRSVAAAEIRPTGVGRALCAASALLALLVGFPVLLWLVAGWSLPHAVPSWTEVSSAVRDGYFPERFWIGAAAMVGWVAWAQLASAVITELAATARRRQAPPARLVAAPARDLARWLVGSAAMVGSLVVPRAALAHPAPPPPPATLSVPGPTASPNPAGPEQSPVYVVGNWETDRDCLWTIAERHLGDGMRWREIWELNRGRPQPDGGILNDAQIIHPGWRLTLPADAVGVAAGDTAVEPPAPPAPAKAPPSSAPPSSAPPVDEPTIHPTITAGAGAPAPQAPPTQESSPARRTSPPARQPPAAIRPEPPGPPIHLGRGVMRVVQALALGLPVFAAGGLVRHLNRRRRMQMARCRPGRDIVRPDAACEALERKARAIAVDEAAGWVDAAVRLLGARLRQASIAAPSITCVRAGQFGLEILLADPRPEAPPGFDSVDEGFVWRLVDVELPELRAEADQHAATTPALVSVGASPEGPLLVDLEGLGVLSVEGSPDRVAAFLAGAALELASAPWAEGVDLHLVGTEPGLAGVEDVSVGEEPAALADAMAALASSNIAALGPGGTTLSGRLAEPLEGWFPAVVVVGGPSTPPELVRLSEVAKPGSGVVLVAPGPLPGATWRLVVVDDGPACLEPLGLSVRASAAPPIETDVGALDGQAIAAAARLLSAASHDDDVAPLVEVTTPTSRTAALQRRTYDVWVKVLGPVEISGWAKPVGRRTKYEEVVTYLATHDDPVPAEVLRAAVWPEKEMDSKSFCQAMSRLRTHLGREAGHLPDAIRGCYCLGTGVGCDWCWFRQLSQAADARSATSAEAMEL